MRKLLLRSVITGSAIVACTILIEGQSRPATSASGAPTFSKDVAPIFYSRCVSCHQPESILSRATRGTTSRRAPSWMTGNAPVLPSWPRLTA